MSAKYLEEMKEIQAKILEYLDEEANVEEYFQNLILLLNNQKIHDDKPKIKLVLHLLTNISNNHHRYANFFSKIEKIIQIFKDDIKKDLSNMEIFNIFKSNKRILLFLIEEKLMVMEKLIIKKITTPKYVNAKYVQYFQPEIQPFIDEKWLLKKRPVHFKLNTNMFAYQSQYSYLYQYMNNKLPENFNELRKIGENEHPLCQIIQKDQIKEFIVYINQNDIPLTSMIQPSIYETNSYLIEHNIGNNFINFNKQHKKINEVFEPYNNFFGSINQCKDFSTPNFLLNNFQNRNNRISLIEYAAFYGSIQIFNYLHSNGVELTPSLWFYSIHGLNSEIMHILENNHVKLSLNSLKESIKCHHNEVVNYLLYNYNFSDPFNYNISSILKYYNFCFLNEDNLTKSNFGYLFKYNYFIFCQNILSSNIINDNKKAFIFFYHSIIKNYDTEMIKLFLNYANIDINQTQNIDYEFENKSSNYSAEKSVLSIAIENENIDNVKFLLSLNEIDVNKFSNSKSLLYVNNNDSDSDDDNNNNNYREIKINKTPLFLAIEKDNYEIIKLLLSNNKIDVNLKCNYFFATSFEGHFYIQHIKERNPLFLATQRGYNEIVKLLLSNDSIDINAINERRYPEGFSNFNDSDDSDFDETDYFSDFNSDYDNEILCEKQTALYAAINNNYDNIGSLLLENPTIDLNLYCYKIRLNSFNRIKYANQTFSNSIQNIMNPLFPPPPMNPFFLMTPMNQLFQPLPMIPLPQINPMNPLFPQPPTNSLPTTTTMDSLQTTTTTNSLPSTDPTNLLPMTTPMNSLPPINSMNPLFPPPPTNSLPTTTTMDSLQSTDPTNSLTTTTTMDLLQSTDPTNSLPMTTPNNILLTTTPTNSLPTTTLMNSLPTTTTTNLSPSTDPTNLLPMITPMNSLPPINPMNPLFPPPPTNSLPTTITMDSLQSTDPTNSLPMTTPNNSLLTITPMNPFPPIDPTNSLPITTPMNPFPPINPMNSLFQPLPMNPLFPPPPTNSLPMTTPNSILPTTIPMNSLPSIYQINSLLLPDPMRDYLSIGTIILQETVIHLTTEKCNIKCIKLLLQNDKIDINCLCKIFNEETTHIKTALCIAVENNNTEIIELLLSYPKIDVNILNTYEHNWYQYKSDVCSRISEYYKTVLFLTVESNKVEILKLLLSNDNIDINEINKLVTHDLISDKKKTKKRTALHEAVKCGFIEIIQCLLASNKIDRNVKDEKGKIPLAYATNDQIIQLFNLY